ncbi:hypothetical protein ACFOOL_08860 [Devosia honganensis]|uniref:Uncharacterized protein n=1 Tax=Devosia honganensis TaxID=1610527 RepID=A0ABV7WZW0_9HYPH
MSAAEAWVAARSYESVADSWNSLDVGEGARRAFRTQEARSIIDANATVWREYETNFVRDEVSQRAEDGFIAHWIRRPQEDYLELWAALQNGSISAWGIKPNEAEFTQVLPIQFEVLRPRGSSNVGTFFAGDLYRLVRLDAMALQRVFPPLETKPWTRGRPPKYDWPSFHSQCQSVWDEHGSFVKHDPEFSRPADLIKIMAQWCVDEWGQHPSESVLKTKVAEFLKDKGL